MKATKYSIIMCFDTRHSVSPLASMDKDFFGRFSIENVTMIVIFTIPMEN